MKFILLRRPIDCQIPVGKAYSYLLTRLKELALEFSEEYTVEAALQKYEIDPENTFMYVDFPLFNSASIQHLRSVKMIATHSCKFELQRSRERIINQRIQDISVTGTNILKCISMISYLTDFDSLVELSSVADNHISGRLSTSGAHVSIEISNPTTTNYRYCVTTESENFCFMVFNDTPFQEQIQSEIDQFISDSLGLRDYPEGTNPYFLRSIYIAKTAEIAKTALTQKASFQLKPRAITQLTDNSSQNLNKRVSFCTTGAAAINQEALFDPLQKIQRFALTGYYASNPKSESILYKQTMSEDAILYKNLDDLVQHFSGIAYVPSLPGKRKENEMTSFLKNNSIVLAEKPGFANATSAHEFAKTVPADKVQNLYFGWHYIHHPEIKEVVSRIQKKEFGEIKSIKADFTRPKKYSKSGRIFEPNQGGCGLDRFCYPLHFALTLAKQSQNSYKILSAEHKNYGDIYNLSDNDVDKKVIELEGTLRAKLLLNQQIEAELFSSMETHENHHSQAKIVFEDSTEIIINWFVHPHVPVRDFSLYCTAIRRKGNKGFEPLQINTNFDKSLSSYDYQIRQIAQEFESNQDSLNKTDPFNLSLDSNIYLQEVLDAIFLAAGLPVKQGL